MDFARAAEEGTEVRVRVQHITAPWTEVEPAVEASKAADEAFDKFQEKVDRLEEKYFERVMDLTRRSRGGCSIEVRTDYGDFDDERGAYTNPHIAGVSAHLTDGVFRTLLELAEKGAALES
jgi:hypothetical protein